MGESGGRTEQRQKRKAETKVKNRGVRAGRARQTNEEVRMQNEEVSGAVRT